ncbi:MAG: hypothetical protein AVDCRST_MAG55-1738, partial [uncultured Rubrobacteraceae bacterium]
GRRIRKRSRTPGGCEHLRRVRGAARDRGSNLRGSVADRERENPRRLESSGHGEASCRRRRRAAVGLVRLSAPARV